jgi:hypothetical protein
MRVGSQNRVQDVGYPTSELNALWVTDAFGEPPERPVHVKLHL